RALVGGEEIQRAPVRADEHLSDFRRLQNDGRRFCHLDSPLEGQASHRIGFDPERSDSPVALKIAPVDPLAPSLVTCRTCRRLWPVSARSFRRASANTRL